MDQSKLVLIVKYSLSLNKLKQELSLLQLFQFKKETSKMNNDEMIQLAEWEKKKFLNSWSLKEIEEEFEK